jgi:hypothetical protein
MTLTSTKSAAGTSRIARSAGFGIITLWLKNGRGNVRELRQNDIQPRLDVQSFFSRARTFSFRGFV